MDDDGGRPPTLDDLWVDAALPNSVAPSLNGGDVLVSLLVYIVVYLLIFPTGFYGHGAHHPQRT